MLVLINNSSDTYLGFTIGSWVCFFILLEGYLTA